MSTHNKHTLAALLAAAVIVVVPASAQAKGGKDHGQGGGHQQNHGGGASGAGGEFRSGRKQAEQEQARQFQDHTFTPRQRFVARENGSGKHGREERFAPPEMFAVERTQKHQSVGRARWIRERHAERAAGAPFETRTGGHLREVVPYAFDQRSERKAERKFAQHVAKQQRAAYRAEAKQERRWAKEQRQALKQVRTAPVVVESSFTDYPGAARYVDRPVYRMREVRPYWTYPTYTTTYDYAPAWGSNYVEGYPAWSYPQSYSGYAPYSNYSPYAPYDVAYSKEGLGGLFGGSGGGIGDILATLLPLVLGDSLGLDGLTGSLGSGLLGSSLPGLGSGYALNDYPAVGYADPLYSYQDPSLSAGLLDTGQSLSGGDGLMSLASLALGSGLLGGDSGSLGGLGGLLGPDDGLGLSDGLSSADPIYAYSDPYTSNTDLMGAFGV